MYGWPHSTLSFRSVIRHQQNGSVPWIRNAGCFAPSTPPGLSCGILQQKCTWRGDPMAEASVLAAPSAHLADNSRKAIWAAAIGNLLEWYDFGVYAYLASLIAAKFFPG